MSPPNWGALGVVFEWFGFALAILVALAVAGAVGYALFMAVQGFVGGAKARKEGGR